MAKHTGIKKLANGRFKARYFAGYDKDGKRQYPAKTFDTQAEAIRWRSEHVSTKAPGQYVEGRSLTVSAYLARWLETKKQTIRAISFERYHSTLHDYVEPYIGKTPLSRLTPAHIETMQAEMFKQKLSNNTVLLTRSILSEALTKAVRQGLIRGNPVTVTDAPKKTKFNRYPLTVEEALRFLEGCEDSTYGLLLRFSLTTGLRPEEVCGLRWADLDLSTRGAVRVAQVAQVVPGGGWRFEKPKTVSSERVVAFPAELVRCLQEHRRQQLANKLKVGQYWEDHDLVFCSRRGRPIHQQRIRKEFKAILESIGIPDRVRWYDLRHAFVTFSLLADVDLKTASREAGHATVAFTLQHYGSVLDEMHQIASDKREGLLKSRSKR